MTGKSGKAGSSGCALGGQSGHRRGPLGSVGQFSDRRTLHSDVKVLCHLVIAGHRNASHNITQWLPLYTPITHPLSSPVRVKPLIFVLSNQSTSQLETSQLEIVCSADSTLVECMCF